jgi:hypothetical protein
MSASNQGPSEQFEYPAVLDPLKVGSYPALAKSGGGYVWDEVLEYRVWCHPEQRAECSKDGSDYYYAFETYNDAFEFSCGNAGAEHPIALILQCEYIDEQVADEFVHVKEERITEWPVQFLRRPRRTKATIPNFLSPNAPPNRLAILRGEAE